MLVESFIMKISEIGSVKVVRRRIKNIYLRVRGDEVVVSAPFFVSDEYIREFVKSKIDWIEAKRVNGFYYLGKRYEVEIKSGADFVEIKDKATIYLDKLNKTQVIENFYRQKAKEILPSLVEKYATLTNLHPSKVKITKAKSRYGSCNYKKGYINLSLFLMTKPIEAIEYVVLHEIAHLKHPNHSKEFYGFIQNYMSDWKNRAKLL